MSIEQQEQDLEEKIAAWQSRVEMARELVVKFPDRAGSMKNLLFQALEKEKHYRGLLESLHGTNLQDATECQRLDKLLTEANDGGDTLVLDFWSCKVELEGFSPEGLCIISAYCRSASSQTVMHGFVERDELVRWESCLRRINDTMNGKCSFSIRHPEFKMQISCTRLGHLALKIDISANQDAESHQYKYEIDPSYLADICTNLRLYLGKGSFRRGKQ